MSFFSFKTKPPTPDVSGSKGRIDRGRPSHENIPSDQTTDDDEESSQRSLIPPGVSLINPNLHPEKAQNFLGLKLPQSFAVRFLGLHPASGIWGIQHTRKAVDNLVSLAKTTDPEDLSLLDLEISEPGVYLRQLSPVRATETSKEIDLGKKPIERISYGVQDVLFPRIFAMISIKEKSVIDDRPFDCYVFLCENRIQSRKMAYCLAKAFKEYGENIKAANYMQTLEADVKKQGRSMGISARAAKSETSTSVESDA
ncbi:uncharacterized protein LOC129584697 [Paramacrobiotus metropolitanus]|uniref:uncharacterized protein LOC129584697 n=1 Tax=Paramacrobiotus metropolitanus TaxID=2943436 RepID=UPI0024465D63|nr:uncharacterized protein LOC129584697 [Paramacrobiotus metropolitanus]